MKKLILLFSLILVAQSAFAYVDNQYMKTERFLVNTGYSAEMAKAITVSNENPYREPYKEGKKAKDIWKRTVHYLSPSYETDLDFYNHSGNFNSPSVKDF